VGAAWLRQITADYRRGDEKMSFRTFLSRWHWQPDTWKIQRAGEMEERGVRRHEHVAAAGEREGFPNGQPFSLDEAWIG